MLRALVAIALLTGCRDREPAVAPPASVVPPLPRSRDGVAELRDIDRMVERARAAGADRQLVDALLSRAAITGRLEDYTEALAASERAVAAGSDGWRARASALSRVHRFAAAREALAHAGDAELAATIDEATGAATPYFEREARARPSPTSLTRWATQLARAGRFEDATALIPKAAALVHDNPATLLAWLLFQWGRIYEQKGELAAARTFYEEAHRRLPGYLEATVHLAQAMRATGADPGALVAGALAANRHPELLALAGQTDAARVEWERYVAALPEAFASHAARFYLASDPARALALAEVDHAARDTLETRALVVEAALAAKAPARACELAGELAGGTRAQLFLAWRAFTACDRRAQADALAAQLGIH